MQGIIRLDEDERGVTAVEFALIAPVLLLAVFGILDIGHQTYATAIIQGAVQDVARDTSIENSQGGALNNAMKSAVHDILPGSTVRMGRKSYTNFTDIGRPEEYDDVNGNGTCDAGESFEDANGNGTWDQDRGTGGIGNARDAVLYTVTVDYERFFPLAGFMGISDKNRIVARTVVRNQPFAGAQTMPATESCE